MRHVLNEINIRGEIVIGEGEIDEAPMLYIGERVGTGFGDDVDIAVDPIEGTRMTAMVSKCDDNTCCWRKGIIFKSTRYVHGKINRWT